jgi:predicted Zn-ribbon and HTH transcriptional regulator
MKPEEKKSLLDSLRKKTSETFEKLKAPFKVVELSKVEKLVAFKKGDTELKPEKFEDLYLEDGVTMIIIEPAVEVGAAAVMKTVDGEPVAAPAETYVLQDGRSVVIEPAGEVKEVREAPTEEGEEVLEKAPTTPAPAANDGVKRIIERVETEKVFERLKEVEKLCAFLKEENEALKKAAVETQEANNETFAKILDQPSKAPATPSKNIKFSDFKTESLMESYLKTHGKNEEA